MARQFLGEGPWEVWDLSPDCDKWCQACSSKAERIVRHDGTCPTKSSRKASGQQRALARRKSIAEARIRPVVVTEDLAKSKSASESEYEARSQPKSARKTPAVARAPTARSQRPPPTASDSNGDESDYEPTPPKCRAGANRHAAPPRKSRQPRRPAPQSGASHHEPAAGPPVATASEGLLQHPRRSLHRLQPL